MKKKITFVTGLVAVMLVTICVGLYRLYMPGFYAVAGILGVYGFFSAARDFRHWLVKDTPESAELPPVGFGAHESGKAEQTQEPPKKKKTPIIHEQPKTNDDGSGIIDAEFTEVPDFTNYRRYAQI